MSKTLETFKSKIESIDNDFRIASAGIQLFEVPNDMEEIFDTLKDTYEANAFNFLTDASMITAIMALMRMLDPPRADRASLPAVIEMLGEEEFVQYLIRKNFTTTLETELENLHNLCKKCCDDYDRIDAKAKQKLRDHRNHFLAHSLVKNQKQPPPKYGELLSLRDQICPVVNGLYFLAFGVWSDPKENPTSEIWYTYSRKFWKRVTNIE